VWPYSIRDGLIADAFGSSSLNLTICPIDIVYDFAYAPSTIINICDQKQLNFLGTQMSLSWRRGFIHAAPQE
jgi:hypothetical protein